MMTLLNGQSLQAKDRFQPESMALNLEERGSTATLTVGPDAPEIKINDWLRDETEPGAGIVWRVKTVGESIETKTRTISLEHVVQYLNDRVLFGEATPKTITGNSRATTCTAREAAAWAMSKQSLWRLGDLEASASNPYSFNGDKIFAALETVTSSLQDMQWEYDLTALPFTLHIRKQPTGFQSEMRLQRNITTMKVQVDRTRMYTRFYPIGKDNLHVDGDYVSRNEGLWGIVCKVETDQSLDTKEKLLAWANERLGRHCEPSVTVTVTGLELSAATGEPLDKITVGRRCRIPLPEYGTVMTERVTKLSWADKIKEPEKITVTLANPMEDVASIINRQSASSAKSKRTGAKKNQDDHAWFVDTSTHVGMVAEAVAGPGAATDWSRVASVIADGQGIHQRVTRTENDVVAMWSSIDVLEDRIVLEVANAKSDTYSKIEQTATSIRTEVSNAKSGLFSSITEQADRISLVVSGTGANAKIKPASIVTAINDASSSVLLSADHIQLDGDTTLKGKMDIYDGYLRIKGSIMAVASGGSGGGISANIFAVNPSGYIFFSDGSNSLYMYKSDLATMIKTVSVADNTLTLTRWNGTSVNFSKATWLTGEWSSSGAFTARAKQNNGGTETEVDSITRHLSTGTKTWDGNTCTVPIRAWYGSTPPTYEDCNYNVTVDASARYNAGFDAVTGDDITLQGYGSSPQSSKPSIAGTWETLSGGKKKLSAYIWAKHKDGKWYRLRSFSFIEP